MKILNILRFANLIVIFSLIGLASTYSQEEVIIYLNDDTNKEDIEYVNRNLENKAEFIGGEIELLKFYKSTSKFEVSDFKKHETSVAFLLYVDEKGKIYKHRILNSFKPEYSREVERIIELMPNWTPATLEGEPVKAVIFEHISFD